jgi:hypothetical protein
VFKALARYWFLKYNTLSSLIKRTKSEVRTRTNWMGTRSLKGAGRSQTIFRPEGFKFGSPPLGFKGSDSGCVIKPFLRVRF